MALPPPDEEKVKAILATIGLNKERLKEAVRVMNEWLIQQPHLPSELGKRIPSTLMIIIILYCCFSAWL
jgi:hypothetical protein